MILLYYFLNILIDINDEVIIGENTVKVTLELLFIITRHFLTHIFLFLTINMMYVQYIHPSSDIRYTVYFFCGNKFIFLLYIQILPVQQNRIVISTEAADSIHLWIFYMYSIYTCYYHYILYVIKLLR